MKYTYIDPKNLRVGNVISVFVGTTTQLILVTVTSIAKKTHIGNRLVCGLDQSGAEWSGRFPSDLSVIVVD